FDVHVFVPPAATSSGRTLHHQLLVRFAGVPEAVEAQLVETERILRPAQTRRFDGLQEIGVWREHRDLIWGPPGAVARVSWLPACPPYVLWGEEMDSPRGRIYLMKAALENRTEMDESFVGHFDACLGCMACVTACPSGVEYGPLIERTRAQIERRYTRSFAD